MEEGNTASLVAEDTSTTEPSESVLNAVEQLTKINKQIVALKEWIYVKGNFLTVEEGKQLTEAEEYKKYVTAKRNAELTLGTTEVYSNDRYSYIDYEGQLFYKESNYYWSIDIDDSIEIFEAFLTKDSAVLSEVEKELINQEITVENIAKQGS